MRAHVASHELIDDSWNRCERWRTVLAHGVQRDDRSACALESVSEVVISPFLAADSSSVSTPICRDAERQPRD
jgi:hypothetical protein